MRATSLPGSFLWTPRAGLRVIIVSAFNLIVLIALALGLPALSRAQVPTVINVEIDWMEAAFHSHKPSQAEIDAVIRMFACKGIELNVVIDDTITEVGIMVRDPNDSSNFFGYSGANSFGEIKNRKFDNNGGGWHYAVFGHQYQDVDYAPTGSSGLADAGANLIVTLGGWRDTQVGSPWDRAATFAHELGHNLGLSHVGSMVASVVTPQVVNLPSIMSYYYQLTGVRSYMECLGLTPPGGTTFKNMDYSSGIGCSLNETALNENLGIGMIGVDWDCNGNIGGTVPHDLSRTTQEADWCASVGSQSNLLDYNEWANIRDITAAQFKNTPIALQAAQTVYSCVSYEEVNSFLPACPNYQQPAVTEEPCSNDRMYYVRAGASGSQTGACTNPFVSLVQAYNASGNGDYLFFSPGNYPGTNLTLSKKLVISGPGTFTLGQP